MDWPFNRTSPVGCTLDLPKIVRAMALLHCIAQLNSLEWQFTAVNIHREFRADERSHFLIEGLPCGASCVLHM